MATPHVMEKRLQLEATVQDWAEITNILNQWLKDNEVRAEELPTTYPTIVRLRNELEDAVIASMGFVKRVT